jgi:hypothetical protein
MNTTHEHVFYSYMNLLEEIISLIILKYFVVDAVLFIQI